MYKYILILFVAYYGGRAHEKYLFSSFEIDQRTMWAYKYTPDIAVLTPEVQHGPR